MVRLAESLEADEEEEEEEERRICDSWGFCWERFVGWEGGNERAEGAEGADEMTS